MRGRMDKIVSGAGLMALGYMISRLLGLLREMAIAWRFGATDVTDIYNAAFLIPDILNHLLAGGAFSIVLVPMLAAHIRDDGDSLDHEGSVVYSAIFTPLAFAVVVLTGLGMLFAHEVSALLYPEFVHRQDDFESLVRLTRVILPAQVFFIVGGLTNATLRARGDFRGNTWGPNLYNLGIIMGCVALGAVIGIDGVGVGVLAGAFMGPFLLSALLARGTVRLRPSFDLTNPHLRRFVRLNVPLMLGVSLLTADEWYIRYFGVNGQVPEGTLTCLKYARTLLLVPVALVGQTAAQASLTYLSQLWQRGETREFADTLGRTLRGVLFLSFILAGGLFAVAFPGTLLLFQRGAFTVDNAQTTATLLQWMVWAAPAFAALQVMVNGYYSRHNTVRPMVLGTVAAAVSFPVYSLLCGTFGGPGIAVATTLCFWITLAGMLADYSLKYGSAEGFEPARVVLTTGKALVVVGVAVTVSELAGKWLEPAPGGVSAALVRLALAASAYGLAVGGGALLVGGEEAASLRSLLRGLARRAGISIGSGRS